MFPRPPFVTLIFTNTTNNSTKSTPISRERKRALIILIALPLLLSEGNGLKEHAEPVIQQVPNSFMFQSIGDLYPVTNFVHMRVSLQLSELQRSANEVCHEAETLSILFNEYSSGNVAENKTFKLSPKMSKDMMNDNLAKVPFERFSPDHVKKKVGQTFSIYFATVLDMLQKGCMQILDTMALATQLFKQDEPPGGRQKRQILGGFALLLGAYNQYELHQLSSTVDQVKQAQLHIVSAVQMQIKQTESLEEEIQSLDGKLQQLQIDTSFFEF